MCKVTSELSVQNKYKLLAVDEAPPAVDFSKYVIDGKAYTPITVYDMPLGIAIPYTQESLVGKEVIFS